MVWPRRRPDRAIVLFIAVLSGIIALSPERVTAQSAPEPQVFVSSDSSNSDIRLLRRIYGIQSSGFVGVLTVSDRLAVPFMTGSVPVFWGGALLAGDTGDRNAAVRLTLSWGIATGTTMALKAIFKRKRPFHTVSGIAARREYPGGRHIDRFSFPSGHAAITSAIVTSLSLSYPRWYVIGPGVVFTGAVSVSRIWLGVHYPSDVGTGILIGIASGTLGYLVGGVLLN